MTTESSPDLDIGTLDLINNELTARAVRQAEAGRGIDTKAGILATFTAAAAQFLATRNTQPVLVWRVGSDFTVSLRDNGACRLLRLLFCVLVMSRD